jgi:hypothetical protein
MMECRDSYRKISVGCEFMSCEWTVRDHHILWINSLSSGVILY